jgi:hypothetical protein
MKLPWHRRAEDACEAAQHAKKSYEQVKARRSEVDVISKLVREQRELNHFADAFRQIMGD